MGSYLHQAYKRWRAENSECPAYRLVFRLACGKRSFSKHVKKVRGAALHVSERYAPYRVLLTTRTPPPARACLTRARACAYGMCARPPRSRSWPISRRSRRSLVSAASRSRASRSKVPLRSRSHHASMPIPACPPCSVCAADTSRPTALVPRRRLQPAPLECRCRRHCQDGRG